MFGKGRIGAQLHLPLCRRVNLFSGEGEGGVMACLWQDIEPLGRSEVVGDHRECGQEGSRAKEA